MSNLLLKISSFELFSTSLDLLSKSFVLTDYLAWQQTLQSTNQKLFYHYVETPPLSKLYCSFNFTNSNCCIILLSTSAHRSRIHDLRLSSHLPAMTPPRGYQRNAKLQNIIWILSEHLRGLAVIPPSHLQPPPCHLYHNCCIIILHS